MLQSMLPIPIRIPIQILALGITVKRKMASIRTIHIIIEETDVIALVEVDLLAGEDLAAGVVDDCFAVGVEAEAVYGDRVCESDEEDWDCWDLHSG